MAAKKDPHVKRSGFLDVGDGHKMYWEDWGNPKAFPILHIHGGPGSAFDKYDKQRFDPRKHRVIFYDQRGCGKSTPFASTKNNTTQHLIADIEKLRKHLQLDLFNVFGGSWGSTLSLLYAIHHPKKVKKLMMYGIYLATQSETDFVNEGIPGYVFPEAWKKFIAFVPQKHRKNGDSIMMYYAKQIRSKNKKIAKKYADEWSLWEWVIMSINYNPKKLEKEVMNTDNSSVAILETHYFLNKCFIPEGFILKNIHKIRHIPTYVVQGRFDLCTPPALGAYKLAKAFGKKLKLEMTTAGHLSTDPENFKAIRKAIRIFFNK